ncbi:MAG: type II secretion system protein GspG [Puniceicoccales bacterium]
MMKPLLFTLTAMLALTASAQETTDTTAEAKAHPDIGRFQISEVGNYQMLVDTASGRVWQVSRRGAQLVMEPVLFEHEAGAKQPLPDYQPEPVSDADLYLPDPELEAERVERATEFVTETIGDPIMKYATTMGAFPPSLAAMTTNLANNPRWQGPYLRASPIDPWGNRYHYKYPGTHNKDGYDVWSLGPDGRESDDDIGNW